MNSTTSIGTRVRISASLLAGAYAVCADATSGESIYPVDHYSGAGLAVGTADLDNDGDPDLVGVGGSGLTSLRNDGNSHFTPVFALTDQYYGSIEIARLDADPYPDALIHTFNEIIGIRGDGAGGFLPGIVLLVGTDTGNPKAGDFNEDGKQDFVVGTMTAGSGLRVFFGTPVGPVNPPVTIAGGGGGAVHTEVRDFNGDGHLDVIDVGHSLNLWLGDGAGHFTLTSNVPLGLASHVAVADLDQDGKLDVLLDALLLGNAVQFFKGNGLGGFFPPLSTSLPNTATYRPADIDNDGKIDLVAADSAFVNGVRIHRSTGPMQFATAVDIPLAKFVASAFPTDVDLDGSVDLVLGLGVGIAVSRGRGNGDFDHDEILAKPSVLQLATGDVNDDGYDDLVATRVGSLLGVSLGQANGSFASFVDLPDGINVALSLELGDLDLDGDLDAATSSGFGLHSLLGDGTGSFSPGVSQLAGTMGLNGFGLADLDADGRLDVGFSTTDTAGHATLSSVQYSKGQAGASFSFPTTLYTSSQPGTSLLVDDLNGDGAADLVFALSTGPLQYLASNGTGGFQSAQSLAFPGVTFRSITGGDLNADGVRDFAGFDSVGDGVRVCLGNGTGFVAGPVTPSSWNPSETLSLRSGDADGDGRLDVLLLGDFAGSTSNGVEILRGNGAGALQPLDRFDAALKTHAAILRPFDADHDGRLDVAFASSASNGVEILRGALPDYFSYSGAGCIGSGGFTPRLRLDGVATPGGSATLSLENAKGGATALLFSGVTPGNVPLPGGCPLLVFPLLPIVFNLPLSGTQPGEGSFHLGGPLPGSLGSGSVFYLQAIVIDPGAPFGFAATNRAQISVH